MGKKEKTACVLTDAFQAIPAMVTQLEAFIKAHKEIAEGYQKYRKNGGEAIPGIEKHLGIKEQKSASLAKKKEPAKKAEIKAPEETTEIKTPKKKAKNRS